jgi:hypothetical protein
MNAMKLFNMKFAGVLLALCLFSVNSQAAVFPALSFGDYSYDSYNVPGEFSDRWDFSLTEDSRVSVKITDLEYKLSLFGNEFSLFDNNNLQGSFGSISIAEGVWTSATLLAGVNYSMYVTGESAGWLGGAYQLDAKVAPVPLPAALGLFVFALAGFFRFSRKASATA